MVHGVQRIFDQRRRVLGRLRALSGKVAHLVRHNGKALACAARAGGLHGGVQRKNICLERNVLNGLDDLIDLVGRGLDVRHGFEHLFHLAVTLLRPLTHGVHMIVDLRGVAGIGGDRGADLADGGRQFLHGGCLLRGALTQGLSPGGELGGAAGHLRSGIQDFLKRLIQRIQNLLQGFPDLCEFAAEIRLRRYLQIALGNLPQDVFNVFDIGFQRLHRLIERSGEGSDLILALGNLDLAVQIALSQQTHPLRNAADGIGHAGDIPPHQQRAQHHTNQRAGQQRGNDIQHRCGHLLSGRHRPHRPAVGCRHRAERTDAIARAVRILVHASLSVYHTGIHCRGARIGLICFSIFDEILPFIHQLSILTGDHGAGRVDHKNIAAVADRNI
ncbi:hypothetical protein SDC9_84784 [bioreactor metagenome]|uniref:Uncharacterized protein n=1 Tax=bioreactor metagenome TaxID=1076179 RepID=A0A644ZBU7_9ZZZZ